MPCEEVEKRRISKSEEYLYQILTSNHNQNRLPGDIPYQNAGDSDKDSRINKLAEDSCTVTHPFRFEVFFYLVEGKYIETLGYNVGKK